MILNIKENISHIEKRKSQCMESGGSQFQGRPGLHKKACVRKPRTGDIALGNDFVECESACTVFNHQHGKRK